VLFTSLRLFLLLMLLACDMQAFFRGRSCAYKLRNERRSTWDKRLRDTLRVFSIITATAPGTVFPVASLFPLLQQLLHFYRNEDVSDLRRMSNLCVFIFPSISSDGAGLDLMRLMLTVCPLLSCDDSVLVVAHAHASARAPLLNPHQPMQMYPKI
jgi:hypothetical protein